MEQMKQSMRNRLFALIISLLLVCSSCFTVSALAAGNSDFEIDGTVLVKYHGKGGEVTVPDGIEILGKWAFDDTEVTKVNLPETLKEIENYCFFSCDKLTKITLPASLRKIGTAQAFAYNTALESIDVAEGNQFFVSVDGVLFNRSKTKLLYYPAGKKGGEYAIPEGTETIYASSISATSLTAIDLPASLTDFSYNVHFSNNPDLKEIRVAEGNLSYRSIDGMLFDKKGTTLLFYPAGRKQETLGANDFPAGMKAISAYAFQHAQHLKNVTIPNGIPAIHWMCFTFSPSLESVTLPESVKEIGGYAFANNPNLKQVTILNPNAVIEDLEGEGNYNIFDNSPNAVLCGYAGSTAQAYAQKRGLNFKAMGDPAKIKAFVARCYKIILGRDADEGGMSTWSGELASGRKAAAEIIEQFVASTEFKNKNVSKADAVEILYKAMLDRPSDSAGKASWVAQLESGKPLQAVINGFCGSAEFGNLCQNYGIKPGTVTVPDTQPEEQQPAASDEQIKAYVSRCYKIVLGRDADEGGMKTWVNELNSGRKAAAEIIDQFVSSAEFKNKKVSNADAVEILYKAMLDRPSDSAGKASWLTQLDSGKPLQVVINGFCGSAEFGNLCKTYGINPGTVSVPDTQPEPQQPAASNEKIQAFVSRCYKIVLGRDADEGGMNTWSGELASGRKAAAEIIEQLVASSEFQNKKVSNADAVEILYKAMLGRGSDAKGKADWVGKLEGGQPLTAVINGFCGSTEFKTICDSYGIKPGTVNVGTMKAQAEETLSGQAEEAAPAVKTTANQNVTKVEIVNASETDANLGTAVQAIYVNEEKAKEFIGRCYRSILGREASQAELDSWISQMLNGSKTPDQIARGFLFSGEFESRNIGGEELVKILYRVYMNREADAEGLATWTQKLNEGTSLQELLNTFSRTGEFKAVVKNMAN